MFGAFREAEDQLIDLIEERTEFQVFVSHDGDDEQLARRIETQADSVGVDVWLFEDDKELGTPIRKKVQDAIEESDAFVVLLTENGSMSAYVHQEIGYAEGTDTPVLPMVHSGVDSDQLAMLRGREQVRFERDKIGEAVAELKGRVKARRREAVRGQVRGAAFLASLGAGLYLLPDEESAGSEGDED